MSGLGELPVNTYVVRRSDDEINSALENAQKQQHGVGDIAGKYAAGVEDGISWLLGMNDDNPMEE